MGFVPTNLNEAQVRYQRASDQIVENHGSRAPATSNQVAPSQLVEGIQEFFAISLQFDRNTPDPGAMNKDEVSQIGDYGLQLLADLAAWGGQLGLEAARDEIQQVSLSAAGWVIRHGGEIRSPEIVVDALAVLANSTQDTEHLKELEAFMGATLGALAVFIRNDLESTNPGRAWRVLHINRAIVATRTLEPELMSQAFDELVQTLPEDAARFFAEGIEQMDRLDYPERVRDVMKKYHDTWNRRVMH